MIVQISGLDKGMDLGYGNLDFLKSLLISGSNNRQQVILKEALNSQSFNAEVNALNRYLRGHGSFRQLVNLIPDKKIVVYEYLSDNLHNVLYTRAQRKLEEEEVKRITRVVLKGLFFAPHTSPILPYIFLLARPAVRYSFLPTPSVRG